MDNNGNNRNGDYQAIGSKRLKVASHRLQTSQFCNCIGRSKTQYIADIENSEIVCFQCSPTQQGKACNHYPIKQHCSRSCITITERNANGTQYAINSKALIIHVFFMQSHSFVKSKFSCCWNLFFTYRIKTNHCTENK